MIARYCLHKSPITYLLVVVVIFIFCLAGCSNNTPLPEQPTLLTSLVTENIQPTTEVITTVTPGTTPVPSATKEQIILATVVPTSTMSLEQLAEGLDVQIESVFLSDAGDEAENQGQVCVYSKDGFYTCQVPNNDYQYIRIAFAIKPRMNLSEQDLQRLLSEAEFVVYPYKTVSQYNTQPPLSRSEIIIRVGGEYITEFQLGSNYSTFAGFLIVDGTSITNINLYLKHPSIRQGTPEPEEENEIENNGDNSSPENSNPPPPPPPEGTPEG